MVFLKKYLTNLRGSAAIEFAFILPVFLLFIFGIIELGYVLWGDSSLKYGATYGARYAFVHPTSSAQTIQNFALSTTAFSAGGPLSYKVTIVPNVSADVDGTFTYTFLMLPLNPITINVHVHQVLPVSS